MSFQEDKAGRRRRKADTETESSENRPKKRRRPSGDVGNALRSAYQGVIDESVPPEMLDLLGKLG